MPTCLNIINTNYNCHFSIYKVGKDYDSSFNVIETNVKKTRGEIECELTNYRSLLNTNALTETEQEKLDLATEIILTYVDDPTDPKNKEDKFLENATPTASSIINTTPRMAPSLVEKQEEQGGEIQYNPYANQPINFDEGNDTSEDNNNLNIFANMMSGDTTTDVNTLLSSNEPAPQPQETSNMGIFFDQDYINQPPDVQTVEQTTSTSRFFNMMDEPRNEATDDAIFEGPKPYIASNNQAMLSAAEPQETTGAGMELGMNNPDLSPKKDINDLLAPMSGQ